MNQERKYPIGYKPDIYSASLTLEYYDIKYHSNIQSPLYRKMIKQIRVPFTLIVLDNNKEVPTQNLKNELIKRIWIKTTGKKDFDKYIINIKNIQTIKHHGKVSYELDEFID